MKKIVAVLCVTVLLLTGLLTSCGSSSSEDSEVELTRGGKIIENTVEDFSASNYDLDELKDFIKSEIKAYKEEHKGRIRVRTDRLRKDTAYLTIRYNKAETYADFNGVVCYSGTITDAWEAGYDFSMSFILAEDDYVLNNAEEDEETLFAEADDTQVKVSGATVLTDESLKVLIIETEADVVIPGDVQYFYCSAGQAYRKSKDTVAVSVTEDLIGDKNLVYVLYN